MLKWILKYRVYDQLSQGQCLNINWAGLEVNYMIISADSKPSVLDKNASNVLTNPKLVKEHLK